MMNRVLGVVAALALERRWIGAPEPLVETSGIGAEGASAAAGRLVERGATALASWGLAGGLDPGLGPGTVVLPTAVINTDDSRVRVDLEWHGRLLARIGDRVGVSTSDLLDVARPISTTREKGELYRRFGAAAVDMESAAVGNFAQQTGISFISVRVVVDTAAMSLPGTVLTMSDEKGRLRMSSLIRLGLRYREWLGLLRLASANAVAGRAMGRVWSAGAPDLGLS
jgi:hypothetical protein